jgi:hypothetical protein
MRATLISVVILATVIALPAQEEPLPFGIIIAEQSRASFTLIGAGARAAGMGGAFTAVADDATAASFNPAGLAQLMVAEASLVVNQKSLTDEYIDFVSFGERVEALALTDAAVEHDHFGINFLSLTLPFDMANRHWAAQLSTHRLVDFEYQGAVDFWSHPINLETGQIISERFAAMRQISSQSGGIDILTASLAVELTQRTLLGVSVNRWSGDWQLASSNRWQLEGYPQINQGLDYAQENQLRGWNVDFGLLLRYPRLNIGARYRTAFDADYNLSSASMYANPIYSDSDQQTLRTSMHWPASLNLGLAVKLSDRWLVAADWSTTDWSKHSFEVPTLDSSGVPSTMRLNFFDLSEPAATTTTATEDWRVGTEYLIFAGDSVIPIRAGWFREPQPSRDVFFGEPLIGEGFSFGIGFKRGSFAADLAVRRKTSRTQVTRYFLPDLPEDPRSWPWLGPNSFGDLKREEITVFASVIIQLPKSSGASGLLHRIFVGPAKKDQ